MEKKYTYEDFLGIMQTLLGENGCPWDRAQTHESLRQYMIEEAYEAVEAIDNKDMKNLCEELGDLLLQIVFHAEIERKNGIFDMNDVVDGVSRKMVSRHTHIFGSDKAETAEAVTKTWEANKMAEKGYKTRTDVLRAVPKSLPALMRAQKVLDKSGICKNGTDHLCGCMEAIKAQVADIDKKEADFDVLEMKIGEILLSCVELATIFKINPEFALTKAVEQFINRFEYIEIDKEN